MGRRIASIETTIMKLQSGYSITKGIITGSLLHRKGEHSLKQTHEPDLSAWPQLSAANLSTKTARSKDNTGLPYFGTADLVHLFKSADIVFKGWEFFEDSTYDSL